MNEVGNEISEALVIGDDLPQCVDVCGHGHGPEHPPLAPRHHVHVALHPGCRALLRVHAPAAMVVVLVVGAPVVAGGGRGRGDNRAAIRDPRERPRAGRRASARARARVRGSREEGDGG